MEQADRDLLSDMARANVTVRKLLNEHRKLEKKVEQFGRYAAYSSAAALRHKELKKEKLRGMDKIMSYLQEHRAS